MTNSNGLRLYGRNALITGASRGLGQAIAQQFVLAGASALLVARREAPLAQTAQILQEAKRLPTQKVVWMAADISRSEDVARSATEAEAQLGGIDILVNNAGVLGPIGPLETVGWDEWVRTIHVNLVGTAEMCRAVIPCMKSRGYGKIINLSGGGATGPRPWFSAYAVSKAAVVRLTETLAHELIPHHIEANVIAPGAMNTEMLEEVLQAGEERAGTKEYRQSLQQQKEGGVSLDEAAQLAVFLASADSDGISGRLLSAVWDDWRHLPDHREFLTESDVFTLRRIVPEDRGWTRQSR